MKIKVFGKKNCAKCETTKNKISHLLKKNSYEDIVGLEFHDLDTVDGMAEGAFHDVLKIPTTVIESEDSILARWEGEVPTTEEIMSHFK
jgi:hypothetical protein